MALVKNLEFTGDVNRQEVIRTERALNEAMSRLIVRKNRYFEEANTELIKAEDGIAQNEQILAHRRNQFENSMFKAVVPGIVKIFGLRRWAVYCGR